MVSIAAFHIQHYWSLLTIAVIGRYPSALHRVAISGKEDEEFTPGRYSIPYFVQPVPDGVVEAPPSLVAAMGKQVYEPITFRAYAEEMLRAIRVA